jgi:lysophospholipase L1-like esterase
VQGVATADSFALDYMSLLAQLRESRRDATLLVLTPIPVYTDGQYGMNATFANSFIPAQIRRIAALTGARLVDLSVEFGRSGGGKSLTCDGVHPLPAGNAIIAKILAKHILAAVGRQ